MRKLSYTLGASLILTCLLSSLSLAADVPKALHGVKAANLSEAAQDFIRPGLKLKIESFTVPADTLKPVVVFSVTDTAGQPVDRAGVFTPGTVTSSWVFARINADQTQYTSYTTRTQTSPITGKSAVQASADSGGTYVELKLGTYQYTFGTKLPANYPKNVTHTLGVYSTRNLTAWGYTNYVVNEFYHYVPDGSPVKKMRDVVATAACNQCHNPISAHGGSRREMLLCNMCHYPGVIDPDTGETVDMKVMTHKIHRGSSLPSVIGGKKYIIYGNAMSLHDYSEVGFPQDIRNCNVCHQKAVQAENWASAPTRDACASCHDNINWETGANHAVGPQVSDEYCSACHPVGGAKEFDVSVKGAHVNPMKSAQLQKPKFEILSIDNAAPGKNPTVTFRIRNKNGKLVPIESMARLGLSITGPTTDYAIRRSETLNATNCIPDSYTGTISYRFATPLPATWAGTFNFAMEGAMSTVLNPGGPKQQTVNDPADVVSKYVAVTGDKIVPRRQIVSDAKCDACHDKLRFHGSSRRNGGSYCSTCHAPGFVSGNASLNMSYMTHKIHAGKDLSRGYKIGNADFSHIGFPGDLRDCQQCHLPGTYTPPLPDGIASTITKDDFFTPTPPVSTGCLSCHDTKEAAAHAALNIASFGEACATCHGTGTEYDVAVAHAR